MRGIVVRNLISLSRNIDKFPFPVGLTFENSKDVEQEIKKEITESDFYKNLHFQYINIEDIDEIEKKYLISKEIITNKLARNSISSSVIYNDKLSIFINEEDHIKINVFSISEPLDVLFNKISEIDDSIDKRVNYAYDLNFGYLTSRITDIGTGIHVKVLIHLPGLTITNYINKIIDAVGQIGVSLHKYKREKIVEFYDIYEISNLITIGKTEKEIIDNLDEIIKRIEKKERDAIETIMISSKNEFLDKIFRSYGILKFAKVLRYEETVSYLSKIRMGINLDLINDLDIEEIDSLFFSISSEEISKIKGKTLLIGEECEIRAEIVRKIINKQ